jgi:hypothetical protein
LPLSTNRGALNQAQKFVLVGGSVESVHYLRTPCKQGPERVVGKL